jgi:hypothetical protein
MKALVQTMRQQEQRHLWSMRWLIVSAFVQSGAVLYIALGAEGRARVPGWAFVVWGVLALIVAALAAIANAVRPQDGVLNLPLGPAYAPRVPHAAAAPHAPPAAPSSPDQT